MVLNENLTNRASWREGRQTDGRTDSPCVLQDFVPFGAAALLPFNLNHLLLKQGTGTADHLLPLGCYLPLLTWKSLVKKKQKIIHQNVKQIDLYQMVPCLHLYVPHSTGIQ